MGRFEERMEEERRAKRREGRRRGEEGKRVRVCRERMAYLGWNLCVIAFCFGQRTVDVFPLFLTLQFCLHYQFVTKVYSTRWDDFRLHHILFFSELYN